MRKLLVPSWKQSARLSPPGIPHHLHGKTCRDFRTWWPDRRNQQPQDQPSRPFGLTALLQILQDCLSFILFSFTAPWEGFGEKTRMLPAQPETWSSLLCHGLTPAQCHQLPSLLHCPTAAQ